MTRLCTFVVKKKKIKAIVLSLKLWVNLKSESLSMSSKILYHFFSSTMFWHYVQIWNFLWNGEDDFWTLITFTLLSSSLKLHKYIFNSKAVSNWIYFYKIIQYQQNEKLNHSSDVVLQNSMSNWYQYLICLSIFHLNLYFIYHR